MKEERKMLVLDMLGRGMMEDLHIMIFIDDHHCQCFLKQGEQSACRPT